MRRWPVLPTLVVAAAVVVMIVSIPQYTQTRDRIYADACVIL